MDIYEFRKKYNYDLSTPSMQQYLDAKFENIDNMLLFQMGDFFELFFEDAKKASNILGIALTKRGKVGEDDIPMCGVPVHALDGYLNKLLESGMNVAICEQLETPEEARKRGGYKAIVQREVTRIITSGTIIEENLLKANIPNYLASVVINKDKASVCYVDLSTSFIACTEVDEAYLISELAKLNPNEILLSEVFRGSKIAYEINNKLIQKITYHADSFFAFNKTLKIILDFYDIADVRAIGEISKIAVCSIGSIIEYLKLTQKRYLQKLTLPKIINSSEFMSIDSSTRRNLEITSSLSGHINGSVISVIDKTMTKQGSRLLYNWLSAPLIDINKINERLLLVQFFYDNIILSEGIRNIIKNLVDIERCITRISMKRSSPRDLLSIKYFLEKVLELKQLFVNKYSLNIPIEIRSIYEGLIYDSELYHELNDAIYDDPPNSLNDGGFIKHSYHNKLLEVYSIIENDQKSIELLKESYIKETGIENLKIAHNNMIGLFIEITSKNINKMNDAKFIHKQTISNAARYTSKELQDIETNIVHKKAIAVALEQEIYIQICQMIIDKQENLINLAQVISQLDVYTNLAYVAIENNYVKPSLSEDIEFVIKEGRHLVVENSQKNQSTPFISNNCSFSYDKRIALLTGPNMSGKSTYLRQNAIITILAQMGSFVPATYAKIGIVDKVFSRIGSGDDLFKGQSTFMLEMLETSAILSQATNKSLIILDEVGRGTSTYDGVSIAWSVVEYIHDKLKSRCLFATHYHELVNLDKILPALTNYTITIEEIDEDILFSHHIVEGSADRSYGVHVAKIAGLPVSVIRRANEILSKFEATSNKRDKKILKTESNALSLFDL